MSGFHFSPRPNRAADIRWRPWTPEAFTEAETSGKPILLAISAVWCHWCHVMDETTYSDAAVIEVINQRYIPIRVDNDRRPDVNARYNQGGWPTTAILTSDGELLKGATYVPPEPMRRLLQQIDAFYADPENRASVATRIAEIREKRTGPREVRRGALSTAIADRMFSILDASFDEEFGGFGVDQKFPQTAVLHFLLDLYARRHDPRIQEIVQRTLHAMAGGGMYDRVEGGFYRYSTTRDFSVPHFEKMLEDLGGLLLACARASAMFADPELARVAVDVRAYVDRTLWMPDARAYAGSQDADETYFALDAVGRSKMSRPYVDRTIYTSWNAEMARALIIAGPLLATSGADPDEWTARGLAVLESLWSTMPVDGSMCRYYDGSPHVRGLLVDQAWAAHSACTAYEATGDRIWLERAVDLVLHADPLFDIDASAYADRPPGDMRQGGRLSEKSFPFDENAIMARALLALAAHGWQERSDRAIAVLETWTDSYRSYGTFAAAYAAAVLDAVEPPVFVAIVGPARDSSVAALASAARSVGSPPVRVETIDPKRDAARLEALGHPAAPSPSAYLCDASTCFARAETAAQLIDGLSHVRG